MVICQDARSHHCNRNLREGSAVVSTLAIPVTVSSSTEEEAAHVLKSPWRCGDCSVPSLQRTEVRKLRLLFSTHGVKGGAGRHSTQPSAKRACGWKEIREAVQTHSQVNAVRRTRPGGNALQAHRPG
ncbi:unnamed protein product [Gadus morhua 'NCC']